MKEKIIELLTSPEVRGKIQDLLKEKYNLEGLNDMHAQADIEKIILNEINTNI